MATKRQIDANKRNAQRSTGPMTPSGRVSSARNAIKHGIFARDIVITTGDGKEDEKEYACLLSELMADLTPQGRMQSLLVEKIAVDFWRLRRLIRYEIGEIRMSLDEFIEDTLERYDRRTSVCLGDGARPRPELEFFDYSDRIEEKEYLDQRARVLDLSDPDFDLSKDEVFLDYVFEERLRGTKEVTEKTYVKEIQRYLRSLTAEEKDELRRGFLKIDQKLLWEMSEVRCWQKIFDRIAKTLAIPHENALTKIMKYEASLERSIFRNLSVLAALQEKRKATLMQLDMP